MKAATARRTRRRVGLAGVVAASLLAAGCTAGQRAQTADEQETLDGTTVRVGAITIGALAIQAPATGAVWSNGSTVPVSAVIVNGSNKADQLTSVTSSSFTGWAAYPKAAGGSVEIPANSRVQFGGPDVTDGPPNHQLLLKGVKGSGSDGLYAGSSIKVTLQFANAGSITATVPVQLTKDPQTSIVPGPSATGAQG